VAAKALFDSLRSQVGIVDAADSGPPPIVSHFAHVKPKKKPPARKA
jgi:hypothetical protein